MAERTTIAGGLTADGQPTRATETSVRGFYKAYRELMGN